MSRDEVTKPIDAASADEMEGEPRRKLLTWLSSFGMIAGLVAAYGTLGGYLGRFLYPARPSDRRWMFVAELAGMRQGQSLVYKTPAGAPVNVTRRGNAAEADAFVALSSTCPHLGCQVSWESQNNRFFCPCHNGVFDPVGKATEGPPAEAGQSLLQYPLRVADGMLFIQVPLEQLADEGESGTVERPARRPAASGDWLAQAAPPGPGHDPCLYPDTLATPRTEAAGLTTRPRRNPPEAARLTSRPRQNPPEAAGLRAGRQNPPEAAGLRAGRQNPPEAAGLRAGRRNPPEAASLRAGRRSAKGDPAIRSPETPSGVDLT